MSMFFQALRLGKKDEDGNYLFKNISFDLIRGDTVCIRGPSGCGKSTLLKALAQLQGFNEGKAFLKGKAPEQHKSICHWRSKVLYVASSIQAPGSPLDFWHTAKSFRSNKDKLGQETKQFQDPVRLSAFWKLPEQCWISPWANLSSGQVQKALLAIAICLEPSVLLLDEPTSALDLESTLLVEKSLKAMTCVWVTHSAEQESRVASVRTIWLDVDESTHSRTSYT